MNPTLEQLIALQGTITKALGQPTWIAGGALRDIWHNRPVKDVDVFLAEYPDNLEPLYEAITGYHRYKPYARKSTKDGELPGIWRADEESKEYLESDFLVLSGGPAWHGLPIQLIVDMEDGTPDEIVSRFDIDLCKIYLREGRLVATPEFRRDSFEKRITVHLDEMRPTDHLDRVMAKYAGWRVRRITAKPGVLTYKDYPSVSKPPASDPRGAMVFHGFRVGEKIRVTGDNDFWRGLVGEVTYPPKGEESSKYVYAWFEGHPSGYKRSAGRPAEWHPSMLSYARGPA